jgi:hypothetical protein
MSLRDIIRHNLGLKFLSLLLAALLWLFVTAGEEKEVSFRAPVVMRNIPAGLTLAGAPPAAVDVRVRGSNVLLAKVRTERPALYLDLKGAAEGISEFPNLAPMLGLPEGVIVTRLSPAVIAVRLAAKNVPKDNR